MAQNISASASGKSKATFSLAASLMNTSNGTFRTITKITRRCGAWSSCGGAAYNNVVGHTDKLIDSSTGKVIKTTSEVRATVNGAGPTNANYATCTFSNFTKEESNAAILAWKNGKLQIKRTLKLISHDMKAGTPTFRNGYYSDTVTITGTNAAYDPTITLSNFKTAAEDTLYANTGSAAPFTFSLSTSIAASSYWEGTTVSKRLELNIENLSGGSAPVSGLPLVLTQNDTTATTWSLTQGNFTFTRANGGFSRGCRYQVTCTLKVGSSASDLSESASVSREIEVATVPMHFNRFGNGIGIGCYSSVTNKDADGVLDVGWPIRGGMLYEEGEVKTGGKWIDGKPIYRLVKNITATTPALDANGSSFTSYKFFTDKLPENIVFSHVDWLNSDGTRSDGNKIPYQSAWNYNLDYYFSPTSGSFTFVKGARSSQSAGTYHLRVMTWYTKSNTAVPASDPTLPEGPEIIYSSTSPDIGVARADYIAMMAGIEIPADVEETGSVQATPSGTEAPGVDGAAPPSEKLDTVKLYHDTGCWNTQMVKNAIGKWITKEEANTILNENKE